MTRKEEREQASNLVFKIRLCPRTSFIRGAEWADRHPRKELWDGNKVLAWMSQNIESYCKLNAKDFNNILFDLRKAMED